MDGVWRSLRFSRRIGAMVRQQDGAGVRWLLSGGVFAVLCLALVTVHGQGVNLQPLGQQKSPMTKPLPQGLFQDWPADRKPALVMILSGQQHSYLKFCGCTERQLGGFERRYNFIMKLREQGWPVAAVDLGDLVMHQSSTLHDQSILKFDTAIKALAAMEYSALGVGEYEFKLPLIEGLSNN